MYLEVYRGYLTIYTPKSVGQYNAVHCSVVQCSAVQFSAVHTEISSAVKRDVYRGIYRCGGRASRYKHLPPYPASTQNVSPPTVGPFSNIAFFI